MAMTLKAARINSGFTQVQMGAKLGISRDKYRAIEKNPGRATVEMAKRISSIVGIPYDDLFFARIST